MIGGLTGRQWLVIGLITMVGVLLLFVLVVALDSMFPVPGRYVP